MAGAGNAEKERAWSSQRFRKKFRKMKIMFDKAMEASNSLYREEQKATAIAKRLQEQNEYVHRHSTGSRAHIGQVKF